MHTRVTLQSFGKTELTHSSQEVGGMRHRKLAASRTR